MKKKLSLVLAMLMLLTTFAACTKPEESIKTEIPSTPIEAEATAEYKDTLVFATASDQDIMDGQQNVTNDKILRTVYSSLVRRGADSNIEGDLAESWTCDETGLVWTFNLRKDVTFHNGKKFTAKDVKASYDRLLDKENPVRYTGTMAHIADTKVVDEYTFQMITGKPYGPMLASLCARANLILDADYIEQFGTDIGVRPETINGTGPYKLVKWAKDEEMVFEAHSEYFLGVAKTPNLVIQIVPEANSRAIAVETNQVDMTDGLAPDDVTRLSTVEGIRVENLDSNGQHLFQFNCAHPIIKDTKIRQAISYALDREVIVKTLFDSLGESPCTCVLHPKTFGYNDLGVIKQDKEKAKQLLKEAGYENGFEFTLMTGANYNRSVEMAEIIAAQLAEVGITAKLEVVESAAFKAAIGGVTQDKFPYGMFIMGAGPSSVDADGLRRLYHTDTSGVNTNNYGWYSNADVDKYLEEAAELTDPQGRLEVYKKAEQILYIDDPVGVWMNDRKIVLVMSDKVENLQVEVKNSIFFENITVKK